VCARMASPSSATLAFLAGANREGHPHPRNRHRRRHLADRDLANFEDVSDRRAKIRDRRRYLQSSTLGRNHRTTALQLKPARLRRGRNPNQIPATQRKSPQPDQTPRAMPLKLGERYVCQNPLCKSEIEVTRPSTDTARNPTCGCGGPMKKPYRRPQFRELPGQPSEFAFAVEQERGV